MGSGWGCTSSCTVSFESVPISFITQEFQREPTPAPVVEPEPEKPRLYGLAKLRSVVKVVRATSVPAGPPFRTLNATRMTQGNIVALAFSIKTVQV